MRLPVAHFVEFGDGVVFLGLLGRGGGGVQGFFNQVAKAHLRKRNKQAVQAIKRSAGEEEDEEARKLWLQQLGSKHARPGAVQPAVTNPSTTNHSINQSKAK